MCVCVCYAMTVCLCIHSVMSHCYRFVEQWVFLGHLDCGVEFGIHGNQEALNRRGETQSNTAVWRVISDVVVVVVVVVVSVCVYVCVADCR